MGPANVSVVRSHDIDDAFYCLGRKLCFSVSRALGSHFLIELDGSWWPHGGDLGCMPGARLFGGSPQESLLLFFFFKRATQEVGFTELYE